MKRGAVARVHADVGERGQRVVDRPQELAADLEGEARAAGRAHQPDAARRRIGGQHDQGGLAGAEAFLVARAQGGRRVGTGIAEDRLRAAAVVADGGTEVPARGPGPLGARGRHGLGDGEAIDQGGREVGRGAAQQVGALGDQRVAHAAVGQRDRGGHRHQRADDEQRDDAPGDPGVERALADHCV
jgi:hypothetical protein